VAASAAGRDSRQFIANSTLVSQNLRNWHRAEQCQFWLLRSPGILSRRVPRGFLPPRRRLLDQPSRSMRIDGCGTLATNSMIRIGARDMPDRFRRGRRLTLRGLQANHSAKARGSRNKLFPARFCGSLKMRSMLRNRLGAAPFARSTARSRLPFLGQIAQLVIAGRAQGGGSTGLHGCAGWRRARRHNLLHHDKEAFLVCLGQIGHGLEMS